MFFWARLKTVCDSFALLTLAGVTVASLSWSPGQVIVEVITLLTVQALGVVVTHTPAVNLKQRHGKGELWEGEACAIKFISTI